MRAIVVSTSRRRAWSDLTTRSLERYLPDVAVEVVWADARLTAAPTDGVVTPVGRRMGALRWADLVLALGERRAAWAALPWLLDDGAVEAPPVLVVDDTFEVLGPIDDLVEAGMTGVSARAAAVDGARTWGGLLPGFVVLGTERSELDAWWRERTAELVGCPDLPVVDPWWTLDVVAPLTSGRDRLAPDTAGDIDLLLDADGGVVTSDGSPLRLVDFGGLRPDAPWWFAAPDEQPSRFVSDSPALRSLCARRCERLLAAGWSAPEVRDDDLVGGIAATPALRRWFRTQLAERGEQVPNPFVSGDVDAFLDLLDAPGTTAGAGMSVFVDLVLEERPDVAATFPHARWRDRGRLERWLWTHGLSEGVTSLAVLEEPPRPQFAAPSQSSDRPFGVNLVGYLGADMGLGVAARRMGAALRAAGVPIHVVSYDRTSSNLRSGGGRSMDAPYRFTLMVITPDQLPLFVDDVGADFLEGHHNIGLWYWESDVLTPNQAAAFDLVDEVWVATSYLREVFAAPGRVPVTVVPSPLVFDTPSVDAAMRRRMGFDDRFTFLFSFDFLSVVDRKNPLGLIEAYCRAFDPTDGTRLVLKSINGDIFPRERERLHDTCAERDDVDLWDHLLPAADRLALLASADCYVSLHRAEGLGLTMAEAMAVGTPVIATSYSGNLDFMDDDSAVLVPAAEVEVGPGGYYPEHGHWAAPDLDAAAEAMRKVRADPDLRARLSTRGRRALEPFGFDQVGVTARDRLGEVWARLR